MKWQKIIGKDEELKDLFNASLLCDDFLEEGIRVLIDLKRKEFYSSEEIVESLYDFKRSPVERGITCEEVYSIIYSKTLDLIKEFIPLIKNGSNEYALISLLDGTLIALEGEDDKVSIPLPHGMIMFHSHPNYCVFSHKDLETISHSLANGYICEGVSTVECSLIMCRKGPLTEESYFSIIQASKRMRRVRTLKEAFEVINGIKGLEKIYLNNKFS
jgi:hypothetical protein